MALYRLSATCGYGGADGENRLGIVAEAGNRGAQTLIRKNQRFLLLRRERQLHLQDQILHSSLVDGYSAMLSSLGSCFATPWVWTGVGWLATLAIRYSELLGRSAHRFFMLVPSSLGSEVFDRSVLKCRTRLSAEDYA